MTSISVNTVPIVLDVGSKFLKVGNCDEDKPRDVFPSIVGSAKHPGIMVGMDPKDWYVGREAMSRRGILGIRYPVEDGLIRNFYHFQRLVKYSFQEVMKVESRDQPILLSEHLMTEKNSREKVTSFLFETFGIPSLCLKKSNVLSLYCHGSTVGVSCDIGYGQNTVCCIYGNHNVSHSAISSPINGRDITEYLTKILDEKGIEMTTSAERHIVNDMKEKLCFVSLDYEDRMKKFARDKDAFEADTQEYELPDGSRLSISDERFRAPEILFKPSLIGSESKGLPENILSSWGKIEDDQELKKEMIRNIVIGGGSSLFPNMKVRLENDLSQARLFVKPSVSVLTELSVWKGGCIYSKLSSGRQSWATRQEFEESGVSIVHRKFF